MNTTKTVTVPKEERLYCLKWNSYIQYGGTGAMPKELDDYVDSHGGSLPPYIPLPRKKVEFDVLTGARKVAWPGRGPLPQAILEYVKEHGALPRNTSEPDPEPEEEEDYGDMD